MKILKNILTQLTLPFLISWLFMSLLVDIVAIPTVFKNVSSLEEAGRVGMTVFARFNCFEIFLATFISLGLLSREKKSRGLISLSLGLLILACFYTFYMTPQITQAGIMVHKISVTDPMYEVLQKQHTTFHNLYRSFDSVKLLVLFIFSAIMIRLNLLQKENL